MFCGAVDGVIVAILLIAATAHPTGAGGLFDALFLAKKMPQRLARGFRIAVFACLISRAI
jgi:hypothetical protein